MRDVLESSMALEALFDGAPCGLLVTAADGLILAANRTFASWTGLARSELVGRVHFDELLTAPSRIYHETHYAPLLLMQGYVNEVAFDLVYPERGSLPVFVNATASRDTDGSLECIRLAVFVANDRRAYERELMLARRSSEQSVKAKVDFLAMFAHEIRNPLAAVLADMDLMQRRPAPLAMSRVARIHASLARVMALLNNMLDISKLEAGKMALESTEFELATVVQAVVHTMRPLASSKCLPLQVAIDFGLPKRVRGDPMKLEQALINLVSNAIKFTERGSVTIGVVSVDTQRDKSLLVRFWIEDTGIGIPLDRQRSIFDEYTQADPSVARQFGGTGLGLAITAKLVDLQGGTLSVHSEPGRGTVVSFEIPLGRAV
jgi:PAS domain S-box-containing protein